MSVILPPRTVCELSPFMFSASMVAALADAGVEGAEASTTPPSTRNPDGMAVLYVETADTAAA